MKHTFITKKYFSMFWGGTLTCMVVSVNLMLDTFMAGAFLGEGAAAGVNLVTPLYDFASFIAMLFSLGVPILYSNAMGRFDEDEADMVFGTSVTVSVIVGTLMCILAFFFSQDYLHFFGADPSIYSYSKEYLNWIPLLFLLLPFQNLICAMIFADGDEGLCLASNIAESLTKILFSLLLIKKLGIQGLAVASCLGAVFSIIICLCHFFREKNSLRMNFHISKKHVINSVCYGLPDSTVWLFMAAASGVLCKFVTGYFGSEMLILVSVVNLMWEIQYLFDGIGEAVSPIIGIYHSEQCYTGVRKIWKIAQKTALAEGAVIGIFCLCLSGKVPGILGITDEGLSRYASAGVRILCLSFPVVSVLYLLTSYYLILEKIGLGLAINFMRILLLPLIFALPGSVLFGIYGLFAGITVAPFAAWLFFAAFINLKYGKGAYPLLSKREEKDVASFLFEFKVTPEEIVSSRNDIENTLKVYGFDKPSVLRILLLFEEIFMLISERNPGRVVRAECSIIVTRDILKLIGRDDGVETDLSDADMKVESLRGYVVSRLTSQRAFVSKHLTAMSFNRNMFEIRMERKIMLDK